MDSVELGGLLFVEVQHFCRDDLKPGIFKALVYRSDQVTGYCVGLDY